MMVVNVIIVIKRTQCMVCEVENKEQKERTNKTILRDT